MENAGPRAQHAGTISRAGALRLSALVVNVALATLIGLFAYAHGLAWLAHPRPSLLLVAIQELVLVGVVLARRPARATSLAPAAWVATIGGAFAPLLLRPSGATADLLAGEIVQIVGTVLALWGIASLTRSFGLLPANRGIRSTGLYRFVRHPLYAAYAISQIGYLICNHTRWNLLVVVTGFACQLLRIHQEERLLSEDSEYVAYKARTRWRLVPFVF